MKKINQAAPIFGGVVFLIFGLIITQPAFSQADVVSQVNHSLAFSADGRSFILLPGATVRTNLLPANGDKEITMSWTEGGRNHRSRQTVNIKDGTLLITEALLANQNRRTETPPPPPPVTNSFVSARTPANSYSTRLAIVNQSSHRWLIREGNFTGLALKPGQSSDSLNVPLGLMQLILLVDLDRDSLSSGRNYIQQVVTGIVVKEQSKFVVADTHLHIPLTGGRATFIFFNETRYELVGVGSAALGNVIGAKKRMRKKILVNEGFINTAWQYIDEQGNKRQAHSEFVIYKGKVRVYIRDSDLSLYKAQ